MAKDGALPHKPHAEKRLAKLKALLEYLINPTNEKEDDWCVSCDQLANELKDFSLDRALLDIEFKNALRRKDYTQWINLRDEVKEFNSLQELFEKAAEKHGLSIEEVTLD